MTISFYPDSLYAIFSIDSTYELETKFNKNLFISFVVSYPVLNYTYTESDSLNEKHIACITKKEIIILVYLNLNKKIQFAQL